MNISYNWILELTGINWSPEEMRERLTMVGLAVDKFEAVNDDFAIEVDVPSNRGDCLSHLGIGREVAALANTRVRLPEAKPSKTEGRTESFAVIEIKDADLCPRYAGRVVRGVKIAPSPDWLVKRLEAIGQRAINNVADITNYVLHEQGQPLHAFDLEKLADRRIVVRRAVDGERIKTLDGVERSLDGEMLVIADGRKSVAIAGVMGGEDSEISTETRDVLIESAYFAPASVRRTSRILGMRTDASQRFERGVDYEGTLRAQERCVQLICEIAGGVASEDAVDVHPKKFERKIVGLRPERVRNVTGVDVDAEEIRRILSLLGFIENSEMNFIVPSWRMDIEREIDLVEEVARHIGYEKIATEIPASTLAGEYLTSERRRRATRRSLTALGFDEAISLSFIETSHDDEFELLPSVERAASRLDREFVTLQNPIIEERTRMRPTLLPGLIEAVRHNFNRSTRDVRLFETGRIFAPGESDLPVEREAFSLIATGDATEEGRVGLARALDFYDLKGAVEAALDAMKISGANFEAASVKHLREGQAARISIGTETIGTIGRLNESIAAAYKFKQPVYLAELDFTSLLDTPEKLALYMSLPRFPSIVRDLSLLVDRRTPVASLLRSISEQQSFENFRGAKFVGVYEGEGVPEGKRSVTLRLEYRADDRTLRDEEVDAMHTEIVRALEEKFGAQLR
ncbi:MAG: phenylalanine--tRNA ligase subunit beta [Acidobacteria bacterium 13_1_20CM_3_53_8]|nr:MAG: phenylalanine--tRNA ligase subunit beta [Acidobacteria bacterium 13_1_20CM_3_53_8]